MSNAKLITQIPGGEAWKLKCCRQYLSTGMTFPHVKYVTTISTICSAVHDATLTTKAVELNS